MGLKPSNISPVSSISAPLHVSGQTMIAKTAILSRVGTFQLKEVKIPALKQGEILLKIIAAGICGTDIRIFAGEKKMELYPEDTNGNIAKDLVLGHEFIGEVFDQNKPSSSLSIGQRVFVEPDIFCGQCAYCGAGATNMCESSEVIFEHYPGAFSQFLIVPAKALANKQVHTIPENLPVAEGTLIEPLACVVHGQERLLKLLPLRRSALIIGGGPIGMLHAVLAKENSFKDITVLEINPDRAKLLAGLFSQVRDIRIMHAPSVASWKDVINNKQYDMVIHACADVPSLQEGLKRVAPSGGLVGFAGVKKGSSIEIDAYKLHYGDIHLIGSSNYVRADILRSVNLLSNRRIPGSLFVSDTFPLEMIQAAMEHARSGKALKVVLKPN